MFDHNFIQIHDARIFRIKLLVPQNIIMDLNNVMMDSSLYIKVCGYHLIILSISPSFDERINITNWLVLP